MRINNRFVILLVLCLSLAAMPFTVHAESSTGSVAFGPKGITPPVDPENPSKPQEPEEVEGTGQTGNLTLDVVPSFDFGTNSVPTVNTTFNSKIRAGNSSTAAAVAGAQSFVQVSDVRDSSDGWNVMVVASAFTNGADQIAGAILHLDAGNVLGPDAENAPSSSAAALKCTDTANDQNPTKILSAAAGKGLGTWVSRLYPTPWVAGTLNIGDDNAKVRLYIPGGNNIKQTAYSCDLTWTLSATP